ncbi:hypothetical protein F5Y15DRAFT_109817 [Xylariaceae sp. FL0016]|nr:hypothetical protein F5Y15DRAFT_109817 [Xylariaceae sp. FL0016]
MYLHQPYGALTTRTDRIVRSLLSAREKPATSSAATPIVIGVIAGLLVVGLITVLCVFHQRRKRRDEREWPKNNQELEDYGFDASSSVKKPNGTYQQPKNANSNLNMQRGSLDDLERSLRGQTTNAWKRQSYGIDPDMKPVQATDRV